MGATLAGFVAGEGCFTVSHGGALADGSPRNRWVFTVSVASRDRHMLQALREFLGCGSIHDSPPRRAHWQPMSTFTVASRTAHHAHVIPFAEHFLLPGAKRRQFEAWRDAMCAYEADRPRRTRSVCSVPSCERFVRGRGLCRSHYYRATGY